MPATRLHLLPIVLALGAAASTAQPLRLERVAGDRQIVTGDPLYVSEVPFSIRVVDAAGQPVAGRSIFLHYSSLPYSPGANVVDEFGFKGFNIFGSSASCSRFTCPSSYGVTNAAGEVTIQNGGIEASPSSAPVAGVLLGGTGDPDLTVPPVVFSEVRIRNTPAGKPAAVVEYFHEPLRRYFITLADEEVALIDKGQFSGWSRSIGAFVAYRTSSDAPPNAVPVCRFFAEEFTSHFYSADPDECDAVLAKWPNIWHLETREAFFVLNPVEGSCPAQTQPVYRLFNNSPHSNHRYVTDRALRDVMVKRGWVVEGAGSDSIAFCVPA